MYRKMSDWVRRGQDLLTHHPRYSLSISELDDLFNLCGIRQSEFNTAFKVFGESYYVGIETGSRIAKSNRDTITTFDRLLMIADLLGLDVFDRDFKFYDGILKGNWIGLRDTLSDDKRPFILAHEIAHAILHSDRGDLIHNPDPQAEMDADKVANTLIALIERK